MPLVSITIVVDNDCRDHCHAHRSPHLRWNVGPVSEQKITTGPLGARYMLQLTDTQQVNVSIQPVDKKGAPAQVQSVAFASSDANVATVTQDPTDQNKAVVVAGLPGTCQIQVTADADLGDGVTNITGTLDITVVGGQAVALSVNADAPSEQP